VRMSILSRSLKRFHSILIFVHGVAKPAVP
jgi:hypothetical protein